MDDRVKVVCYVVPFVTDPGDEAVAEETRFRYPQATEIEVHRPVVPEGEYVVMGLARWTE